jgi:hypothetical protein
LARSTEIQLFSVWNLSVTLHELCDVAAMQEILNRDLLWLFSRDPEALAADQRTVRERFLRVVEDIEGLQGD